MANPKRFCTTRPIIPSYSKHPTIHTSDPRISLRPFHPQDLSDLHELRSQIEVMQWTSKAAVDVDLATTKTWMERFMEVEVEAVDPTAGTVEHNSEITRSFNFVVVIQLEQSDKGEEASKIKVIGGLGCHRLEPEAEVGYMIRKEYWGQGIVTKAMRAFIESWWSLERRLVDISVEQAEEAKVHGAQLVFDEDRAVTTVSEIMVAEIVATNIASQRILEKCGFVRKGQKTIMEHGVEIIIVSYVLNRPSGKQGC